MPESKQRGLSNLEESCLQEFKKLEKELTTTVHVEADSLRQVHYREATGSALNILQILHQLRQGAKAYIDADESEMGDLLNPASIPFPCFHPSLLPPPASHPPPSENVFM